MHLNPRVGAANRRRTQIHQARRSRTKQHDLALQLFRLKPSGQRIGGGKITKAALHPAIGDQAGGIFIDRYAHATALGRQIEPLHAGIAAAGKSGLFGVARHQGRLAKQQTDHGQRKRLVVLPVVLDQHRHPPGNAVKIHNRIEVASMHCVLLELRQIAAVAAPRGKSDIPALERARLDHGIRQRAVLMSVVEIGKVIAENNIAATQCFSKTIVVVKGAAQALERQLECRVIFQLRTADGFQRLQAGTAVRLRKNHVKAEHGNFVRIEKLGNQGRQLVAAPWPAPHLGQTPFIDIENDDTLVNAAFRRQTEAGIVDESVQGVDQRNLVDFSCMAKKTQ